jgi:hypothetical protein
MNNACRWVSVATPGLKGGVAGLERCKIELYTIRKSRNFDVCCIARQKLRARRCMVARIAPRRPLAFFSARGCHAQ